MMTIMQIKYAIIIAYLYVYGHMTQSSYSWPYTKLGVSFNELGTSL